MASLFLGLNLRAVGESAAAVLFRICGEHFGISSRIRNTYNIILTKHRLEIAYANNLVALLVDTSEKKN